jgi:hypothetical protein
MGMALDTSKRPVDATEHDRLCRLSKDAEWREARASPFGVASAAVLVDEFDAG